jgi:hypothetical protein
MVHREKLAPVAGGFCTRPLSSRFRIQVRAAI